MSFAITQWKQQVLVTTWHITQNKGKGIIYVRLERKELVWRLENRTFKIKGKINVAGHHKKSATCNYMKNFQKNIFIFIYISSRWYFNVVLPFVIINEQRL